MSTIDRETYLSFSLRPELNLVSMLRPEIIRDVEFVNKYSISVPFGSIFFGFEVAVLGAIYELSKYNADLIIVVPLKTGTSLETTLSNLANIDLPLKTGVIFALDRAREFIFNKDWFERLKSEMQKIAGRFVFVEIVHTTARPLSPRCALNSDETEYYKMGMKQNAALHEAGFTNVNVFMQVYACVREEIRLILKCLECKYVLWFDADQTQPRDVVARLLQVIEGETQADLAAGWAYERHYIVLKPTFDTLEQFEPTDEIEAKFYQDIRATNEKIELILRRCYRAIGQDIIITEILSRPIAPSTVKRLVKPVEILFTGFGCVLMKKEVNDNSSFITNTHGDANSEDSVFCHKARKHGYKLVVEPTVFCEHIDEKPQS